MVKNYNKNIINQHTRNEAKAKHSDSERWKNYAERVQKHPFVREYLIQKYNGICQYCGLPIAGDFQIQHGTYDKECIFEEQIRVKHKTKRRPNGTRKVPDCVNVHDARQMMSHLARMKQADVYGIYEEYIKDNVNPKQLRNTISTYDKKERTKWSGKQ